MAKEFYKGFLPVFLPCQNQRKTIPGKRYSRFCKLFFVAGACFLASCGNKNQSGATKGNSAALQAEAKSYGVITLAPRKTVIYSNFPATIQGQQNVEIRPKIDGYMEALYVDEGSVVKKGQLLFRISAETYKQDVRTAEANIKIAKADLNAAQMQVNKVRPLVERNI